jgi:hypothetical protein
LIRLALLLFTISIVGTAVVIAVVVRLPASYFLDSNKRKFWSGAHPILRWTGLLIKNLIGIVVVAIGVVLSLPGVPGPGLLTILVGIMLLDFPGKRKIERRLIRLKPVLGPINWLRRRFRREPFIFEDHS